MKNITQAFKLASLHTNKVLFSPFDFNNWINYGLLACLSKATIPGLLSLCTLLGLTGESSNTFYSIIIGSLLIYFRAHATFILMDSILQKKIDIRDSWGKYANRSNGYLLVLILMSWITFLSIILPGIGCLIVIAIAIFLFFLENIIVVAMVKMSDHTSIVEAIKTVIEKIRQKWSIGLVFCLLLLVMDCIYGVMILIAISYPLSLTAEILLPDLLRGMGTLIAGEVVMLFNLTCPIYFIFRANFCLAFVSSILPEYKSLYVQTDKNNTITARTMYDGWSREN